MIGHRPSGHPLPSPPLVIVSLDLIVRFRSLDDALLRSLCSERRWTAEELLAEKTKGFGNLYFHSHGVVHFRKVGPATARIVHHRTSDGKIHENFENLSCADPKVG